MQVSDLDQGRDTTSPTCAGGVPATSADAPIAALASQNVLPSSTADNRVLPDPCALDVPWERGPCVATFDDLSAEQAYGHACVCCGGHFDGRALRSVPVGIAAHGGKVFACPGCAEKSTEDGGLGFDPADGWQGGRA